MNIKRHLVKAALVLTCIIPPAVATAVEDEGHPGHAVVNSVIDHANMRIEKALVGNDDDSMSVGPVRKPSGESKGFGVVDDNSEGQRSGS